MRKQEKDILKLAIQAHLPECSRPLTGPCECEVMTRAERAERIKLANQKEKKP